VGCLARAIGKTNFLGGVFGVFQSETGKGNRVVFRSRDVVVEFRGDLLLTRLRIGGVKQLTSSRFFAGVTLCDLLRCVPLICQRIETFDDAMRQLSLEHK